MKTKRILTVVCLIAFVLSLNTTAFSGTVSDSNLTPQQQTGCLDSGVQLYASSSDEPFQAYLCIATNSYGAPNPSTGHVQETVPANTNIWIIEKKLYSGTNRYYYYAGYSYNGQSHRGYFCEDNVYYNGSKLAHSNITAESNPAKSKSYTSLATTVYDGPSTSYAVTGSVEEETIKLIRNEGDYNFIQYTVTSTGKIKRGYISYKKIKNVWSSLTEQLVSKLNGKTFYIKNASTGKYLNVKGKATANNTRLQQTDFTGDTNQIFKFKYNSTNKYFCIFPANCYNVDRRLAIKTSSSTNHADRYLTVYDTQTVIDQRFWVVKQTNNTYKIVTVSSYGTMSLTNRSGYINQYYTNTSDSVTTDEWILVSTTQNTGADFVDQTDKNWCWAASGMSMASTEQGYNNSLTIQSAIQGAFGNTYNSGGTIENRAQLANYCVTGNKYSNTYDYYTDKIYSENALRRFILEDHPVGLSMYNQQEGNHAITVMKFEWIDREGETDSPGEFRYYYYDSFREEANNPYFTNYNSLRSGGLPLFGKQFLWDDTAAYKTSYSANVENCEVNKSN